MEAKLLEDQSSNLNVNENQESVKIEEVKIETGTSSQTLTTMDDLSKLFAKLSTVNNENLRLKIKNSELELSFESFTNNDIKTKYFTGLNNYKILMYLHEVVSPFLYNHNPALPTFSQFLITLIKLRLNLPMKYLSYRYVYSY